jgi:hypothetical protein
MGDLISRDGELAIGGRFRAAEDLARANPS